MKKLLSLCTCGLFCVGRSWGFLMINLTSLYKERGWARQ